MKLFECYRDLALGGKDFHAVLLLVSALCFKAMWLTVLLLAAPKTVTAIAPILTRMFS